ncbi:hypothetical protein MJO28_000908 [Puccinia striiformis f. sp. tritici]|uniref:Uncharacterized protein n=1 Tax=Puccinia striiformis f. sp. tritici TaxID=168172 RepID=A0ACC0F0E0_9BASI|nr:hypothetical protein Pst134EB_001563 [Puccinia striiformis f. sp. tritici]KAI7962814.1 hypothetical protein MJO28_000908 [Puccinia striiformis f. sp. tritici]KAI7967074.1 hypothetical protein MJO29_000351 [Puccinia striiformis f. sp. tritici]KAI9601415.1 hypothetical protein H4Q26_001233 [Puccinia striiformis f. sp. tritici PST-130]
MNLPNFFNSLLVVILIQGEALHVQSFGCKHEALTSGYTQAYCATYHDSRPPNKLERRRKKKPHIIPIRFDGYSIVKPTVSKTGDNSCKSSEQTCCSPDITGNWVPIEDYTNNCNAQL